MGISTHPLPVKNASLPKAPSSQGAIGPWGLSEQDAQGHQAVAEEQERGTPGWKTSCSRGVTSDSVTELRILVH